MRAWEDPAAAINDPTKLRREPSLADPRWSTIHALVDGFVFARSVLNHSINYRSVMVFREPTDKEYKRVAILKNPLAQVSAKVSAGPPEDVTYD